MPGEALGHDLDALQALARAHRQHIARRDGWKRWLPDHRRARIAATASVLCVPAMATARPEDDLGVHACIDADLLPNLNPAAFITGMFVEPAGTLSQGPVDTGMKTARQHRRRAEPKRSTACSVSSPSMLMCWAGPRNR